MPTPPFRHLPPRGSTDWGASEFYRLLEEDERIAAERERLRAMGWRPPQPDASSEMAYQDEGLRDSSEKAVSNWFREREVTQRALTDEARRLAAAPGSSGIIPPAKHAEPWATTRAAWAGGGRYGTTVPPRGSGVVPVSDATTYETLQLDRLLARSAGGANSRIAAYVALAVTLTALMNQIATTPEEWEALQRKRAAVQFAYQRMTHIMAAEFTREEMARIRAQSGVNFDLVEEERPEPPRDLDPEEARRIQQEFGGPLVNIPPAIDTPPESIPIQEEIFPSIFVGPDPSNPLQFPTWMEDRRGSEPIRYFNSQLRGAGEDAASDVDEPVRHRGGARNSGGLEIKETFLPNADTNKVKGGNYIDLTFVHDETGRRLLVQSVDTRASGSLTSREHGNNVRVVRNMRTGDIVVLVPKPMPGQTLNVNALRALLRPLMQELGQPAPSDPRNNSMPEDVWRMITDIWD